LLLSRAKAYGLFCEWLDWEKYYLPKSGLVGRTVLDVGAGCGETAHFFFSHGARQVIAIEMDPGQLKLLSRNADVNRWNANGRRLKIIPRPFELADLQREEFDFVKMDIEGGESALLQLPALDFPIVLEVHSDQLRDSLSDKFGLSVLARSMPLEHLWLMGNAWSRSAQRGSPALV
jgi:SAM-dependent methyltransferase